MNYWRSKHWEKLGVRLGPRLYGRTEDSRTWAQKHFSALAAAGDSETVTEDQATFERLQKFRRIESPIPLFVIN